MPDSAFNTARGPRGTRPAQIPLGRKGARHCPYPRQASGRQESIVVRVKAHRKTRPPNPPDVKRWGNRARSSFIAVRPPPPTRLHQRLPWNKGISATTTASASAPSAAKVAKKKRQRTCSHVYVHACTCTSWLKLRRSQTRATPRQ